MKLSSSPNSSLAEVIVFFPTMMDKEDECEDNNSVECYDFDSG